MHHLIYVPIFPWFGAIELCPSCHAQETLKELPMITNQFGTFPKRGRQA